jgi:dihydrodipicolinate synthase/N-acetylneuraminate lyase
MFTGTYTAIVTPFRGGQLDEAALERLVKFQIKGGVDGIVPVGTTGESPTVNYEEHIKIVALSVKFAAGKIKVLAGTGGNATSEAIYLTQEAEKAGADGSLLQQAHAGGVVPTFQGHRQGYQITDHFVQCPQPLRGGDRGGNGEAARR